MSQNLPLDASTNLAVSGLAVQLRVLSGLHAGAAVLLEASHSPSLTLGPSPDHDVVLRDAPGQAELVWRESTWWWCEPGFEQALPMDGAWTWGPVHFSLASPQAPWRMPQAWLFERLPVADALDDEASAVNQVASPALSDLPDANDPQDPVSKAVPGEGSRRHDLGQVPARAPASLGQRLGVALLALLGASVALVWWMSTWDAGSTTRATGAAAVSPQVAAANTVMDVTRLMDVLQSKGYSDFVRVKVHEDGRPILLGVVADDDALDQLLAEVSQVTRRIVLNVITDSEFKLRVQGLQVTAPAGVKLNAQPVGLLALQLGKEGASTESDVLAWANAELPEAVHVYMAGSETARSKAILAEHPQARTAAGPRIKAILGGSNPYVLLATGEKWLPGGVAQGWTLLSIEADELLLQNAKGEQLSSPR